MKNEGLVLESLACTHSAFSQTCKLQALASWLSALLTYIVTDIFFRFII